MNIEAILHSLTHMNTHSIMQSYTDIAVMNTIYSKNDWLRGQWRNAHNSSIIAKLYHCVHVLFLELNTSYKDYF